MEKRVFVAHRDDSLAIQALVILKGLGATTMTLQGEDPMVMTNESLLLTGRAHPAEQGSLPDEILRKLTLPQDEVDYGYFIPPFAARAKELLAVHPRDIPDYPEALARALTELYADEEKEIPAA